MKKKILLLAVLGALMLFLFSGCMYQKIGADINADGSGTVFITEGYAKSYYEEMVSIGTITKEELDTFKKKATKVKQNGKIYYCVTEETKFSNTAKLEKILSKDGQYVHADESTFFMINETELEEAEDLSTEEIKEMLYMEITVTFANPIQKHIGGKLSNDNKTITWDMDEILKAKDLYATTTTETKKAVKVNVGKNKCYKKAQTIKVNSGAGTVYLDGIQVTSGKTKAQNGAHTVVIVNQNGSKKVFDFVVDTKAPTIQGVKNNKTYANNVKMNFDDEESGIKKVTVNGKKLANRAVKNGYTVKSNGKYTVKVTDKAGNVKTMKFSIMK